MTNLTKDAILAAQDLKTESVKVPEWGGEVSVRTMTGTERDEVEAETFLASGDAKSGDAKSRYRNLRARVLVRVLVNEKGERLFGDSDIEALGRKSTAAIDRLFAVAQRLNALTEQDVEALLKN